jgi:sulfur carrier protein
MDVVIVTLSRAASRWPANGRGHPAVLASARMAEALLHVVVNGESREIPAGTTVAGLIQQLGLGDRRVAVERNREVVPRAHHADTALADGDHLELVTFVGGG